MNCMLRREEIFREDNRGYHYILIIDVLSKHAWAEPLKAKSENEMTKTIAKIIQDDGRGIRGDPINLHINRGKEFSNLAMQKLLKSTISTIILRIL